MGRLGVVLGPSWGYLGPSWGCLGPSWDVLGRLGTVLRCLGAVLRPFWCHLGPPCGRLGVVLARFGASRAVLRPFWCHLGPPCGRLGVVLARFGASRASSPGRVRPCIAPTRPGQWPRACQTLHCHFHPLDPSHKFPSSRSVRKSNARFQNQPVSTGQCPSVTRAILAARFQNQPVSTGQCPSVTRAVLAEPDQLRVFPRTRMGNGIVSEFQQWRGYTWQ